MFFVGNLANSPALSIFLPPPEAFPPATPGPIGALDHPGHAVHVSELLLSQKARMEAILRRLHQRNVKTR